MRKTRGKLNEAKFFLQLLEKNYLRQLDSRYYLSAFVSSARSVLWIMRSEYSQVEGWESWYSTKEPSPKEAALLKRMNSFRVKSEKVEPLEPKAHVTYRVPKESITEELLQELLQTLIDSIGEGLQVNSSFSNDGSKVEIKIGELHYIAEFDKFYNVIEDFDDDVLDLCKEYYSLVDAMVSECEGRFDPKQVE